MLLIEKLNPEKPISAVYFDGDKKQFNVKRFNIELTDRKVSFITEKEGSYLEVFSTDWKPVIEIIFAKVKGKQKDPETIDLEKFISIKGLKAIGNKLTNDKVKMINLLDPIALPQIQEKEKEEVEDNDAQATLNFDNSKE